MIIVHFEVYVLEGRGWMLHARFPRLERDEAIREAKELESTMGVRVKVLRETYNTDTNAFDEADVYISGANVQPKKGGGAAAGGGGRSSAPDKAASGKSGSGQKRAPVKIKHRVAFEGISPGTVILRLTIILLVALGLGLGALRVLPSVIVFLYDFGFRITAEEYGQLLFPVFGLVFLMTGVPLALRFMPRNANFAVRKTVYAAPQPSQKKQRVDAKLKKSLDKLAAQADAEQIPDKWSDDEPVEAPSREDEAFLPEILPGPDETPPPIMPEPEPEAKAEQKPSTPNPALDGARPICNRFLDHAVETVRKVTPALDKYNVFALNLYMAGALQALAGIKRLDGATQRDLLKDALVKLGTSADIAGQFQEKISEYQLEPRYMKVIQVGRAGMESWVSGDEGTPQIALQTMIKDWNKPTAEKKSSIMTVMFTDMVGSTDLTQARGDLAAQEIVRKHNAIVRTALTQFAGHEVKHTGDGIMASFASAANAVDATIQIQRQVAAHNEKQPNLPLHLRIGLNSGEPIQEEDDLFGSTVQLAARVCAATQSDQTLCTQVVKDLAGSKALAFSDGGTHSLKGFRDKFLLWEVAWR
ncbi:MAG: adenylate/guanylate cyclase domain-containing protein [Phaeospirillum sp.]|nr:adenylate/guanylate cyclase domain-containing protein [Phaeospirillum sp.]